MVNTMDADYLNDILDGDKVLGENEYLYYFGNDADTDGAMKTGNVNINLDGESFNFKFQKTSNANGGKGHGVTEIDDKKYIYMNGCRIKADSDDKYQLVRVIENGVEKVAVPEWDDHYYNKDDEKVNFAVFDEDLDLVNTSGNLQKNKNGVKDGNDCYFYVDTYKVKLYTDNKSLKDGEKIEKWEDLVPATDAE